MNSYYMEDVRQCVEAISRLKIQHNDIFYITGATGTLGKYLIDVLLEYADRYDVSLKIYAVARNKEKFNALFQERSSSLIYTEYPENGNIKICEQPQYFIHAAGSTNPLEIRNHPYSLFRASVLDVEKIYHKIDKKILKHFIYISSASIYKIVQDKDENKFHEETEFLSKEQYYSASKQAGDLLCQALIQQYNAKISVIRPFHMYGPGMDVNRSDSMVYEFFYNAMRDMKTIIHGNGEELRNLMYLRDVIIGIISLLFSEKSGLVINLGNPNSVVSIKQFMEEIYSHNTKKITNIVEKRNRYQISLLPDLSQLSDFWPKDIEQISLTEGIDRTYKYYMEEMKV